MNRVISRLFWSGTWLVALMAINNCSPSRKNYVEKNMVQQDSSSLLSKLLGSHPEFFGSILQKQDELNVQIIYTQITRDSNNHDRQSKLVFTDHYYNVDNNRYIYPASTVKLPVAILALQRLNELKKTGLDKYTTMITEANADGQTAVHNDPGAEDGRPTIAHYIKKILLVSDNDAFNRLYEFLGQEYINKQLHKMGYKDAQIIHRLSIALTEEQNRHTNPVRFVDTSGKVIYRQKAKKSRMKYDLRDTRLGQGYMKGSELVKEPFDFTYKNRLPLTNLHMILRSIIYPDFVPKEKRFNLTQDDYDFLHKYMSMYPREAGFPAYDPKEYPDTFVKKLIYGNDSLADPSIRIYNKTGTAYGFLIDAAYIRAEDKAGFFLTAAIYCNSDGIFNDDKYDYDTVGYPFFKHLGRIIYDYEVSLRPN